MNEELNINETSGEIVDAEYEEGQVFAHEDVKEEAQQHNFEVSTTQLIDERDFPLDLDMKSEVQNILAAGIFRNIENPNLYPKLCQALFDRRYIKLITMLFWVIFSIKYQPNETALLDKIRKRLGETYSKFFTLLKQPKEDLANYCVFTAAYACHITFFNIFPKDRPFFDMRFILDCYHITIHEIYGIFVSDYYIQSSIEKMFGGKFFHFEKRVLKKKKPEKKDISQELLLKNLTYDGRDLPNIQGGVELAQELSQTLRKVTKKFKSTDLDPTNSKNNSKIMRLTAPEVEDSFQNNLETSQSASYFPRLRLNCNQISPTMSRFLDNSTQTLPFQKKKFMYYSNNKHIAEEKPLEYTPTENETSKNKMEEQKKKLQSKKASHITDYGLKNRPDDYYISYAKQDLRNKFRDDIDMKYILDNIHVSLRGWYSTKAILEETKKIHLPTITEKPRGVEEEPRQETETEDKKAGLTLNVSTEDSILSKDSKEFPLPSPSPQQFQLLKRKVSKYDFKDTPDVKDTPEGTLTPAQGRDNSKEKLPKLSLLKKTLGSGLVVSQVMKTGKNEEMKTPKIEFNVVETSKKVLNLQNRAEMEEKKEEKQKFKYEDKRKDYFAEHSSLINQDVDTAIDELVRKLVVKQNVFTQNFHKYAKTSIKKKKIA